MWPNHFSHELITELILAYGSRGIRIRCLQEAWQQAADTVTGARSQEITSSTTAGSIADKVTEIGSNLKACLQSHTSSIKAAPTIQHLLQWTKCSNAETVRNTLIQITTIRLSTTGKRYFLTKHFNIEVVVVHDSISMTFSL